MFQFAKEARETWITGIGIVSSLGDGVEATWDDLHQGRVNIDRKTYVPWAAGGGERDLDVDAAIKRERMRGPRPSTNG
jgi:3-oxoacyl-(acyl-carrier-protein) synthase